ncbi:MAG: 6-bladed beta-propeller, partial [Candidatus Thorarchaeota archaeon]
MRFSTALLAILILVPMIIVSSLDSGPVGYTGSPTLVDLGNGDFIEVAPDEVLLKYEISSVPTSVAGTGAPLYASEYGTRTDLFQSVRMKYSPGSLTTASLSVPLGDDWEGYRVNASISSITENRTWLTNYQFTDDSVWSFGTSYREGWFNGNNRIHYFTSTGTHVGMWGSRGSSAGQFIDPWGIAFDSSGNIYVADTQNNRIQVFSSTGSFIRQWGSFGTGNGQFNRPTGIAVDGSGLIYVVDSGNDRIQVFNSQGVYQRQWGSSGVDNGEFRSPTGIAYNNVNGYLYVTDTGNDRVQYFNTQGVRQGGWGSSGTGTNQFRMPTGIAVIPAGTQQGQVIVADSSNNRVIRFSSTGTYQSYIGSYVANGGGGNGQFRTPMGVAVNADGTRIYVNDLGNHRVQYFTSTGTYSGRWGTDGTGNNNIRFGTGIAVSSTGNVYVAEAGGFGRMDANWLSDGHGTGNPSSVFQIDGYWHDAGSGLYGFWYNPGDKAFVRQQLYVDRGQVTWAGLSLDFYADCRGWSNYMTGFFELFASIGDPDAGGSYLWSRKFDSIPLTRTWYSTRLISVDPNMITTPNVPFMAGLRVTASEWYRDPDIRPEGRLDNIVLYIKAKATPSSLSLRMNGVNVQNVMQGGSPVFGLGTVTYVPSVPWTNGLAFANFSWSPSPYPPDPNLPIWVEMDATVTVSARRHNIASINNTEYFTTGDNYYVQNATRVRWETKHYVAGPGGYGKYFFFNVSLPLNRDIDYVAEPRYRYVNLTRGWSLGDPGDGALNVSVYQVTRTAQNGFWYIKGSSPNIISSVLVWNSGSSSWTKTAVFRANSVTRFRAVLSPEYASRNVVFVVYDPAGAVWKTLQATVDPSGIATTTTVTLGALNASVGSWEVQAFAVDAASSESVRNVGYFRRAFAVHHSTSMTVRYPVEGQWSYNTTYRSVVLLQLRVSDSDTGSFLPGGVMTYSWAGGSGVVSDLGTGEYAVPLDTSVLSSGGGFQVSLSWSKSYYDSIYRVFTLNVILQSELMSPDAPGVAIPRGYDAELRLQFKDQLGQGITGAMISCNWSLDNYQVTPVVGQPGQYVLELETDNVPLGYYKVSITAKKSFVESRTIILSVRVRELYTSAIPSTSLVSVPVGYESWFTVTYTDTDHSVPISGAASAFQLNWTGSHGSYSVRETSTPGVYNVSILSLDTDVLGSYVVMVSVSRYGAQNHTFYLTVVLRTHLTSFYLLNSILPTSYTADIRFTVVYYDVDAGVGIENGSTVGYYVRIYVESPGLATVIFSVFNGSAPGEYLVIMPADQWGSIGTKDLTIYVEWTGPTEKYYDRQIVTSVRVTGAPTYLYVDQSPPVTPYGENVSFVLVYLDVEAASGIANTTGPYPGHVHIYVVVLTPGQTITQSMMIIAELDPMSTPGRYLFRFNTSLLEGLGACQFKIMFNWTKGQLPLYENRTITITVYTASRNTVVDIQAIPVIPYDTMFNVSIVFRDVYTGLPVIPQVGKISVYVTEPISYTVFASPSLGGVIIIQINSASWPPGTRVFHVSILWYGEPYYRNQTGIPISVVVRERQTSLTHGAYSPAQYLDSIVVVFTYSDLDDSPVSGIAGSTLTLDAWLAGQYSVVDNLDGTYRLTLATSAFGSTGVFMINVTIHYSGTRYCTDAVDIFYITITTRATQLTALVPDSAPYLSLANITVVYIDDSTGAGIAGASVTAECDNSTSPLVLGSNYYVYYLGNGRYEIRIETTALGNFGEYVIHITAGRSGVPYYQTRYRDVVAVVIRRPLTVTVVRSPLNTPYLDNISLEITVLDALNGNSLTIGKSMLYIYHGPGLLLGPSDFSLVKSESGYVIRMNSTLLSTRLVSDHPLIIMIVWGNTAPYYSNGTAGTDVTTISRFTFASVVSAPAADYYYNATAKLGYYDYLRGTGIRGASVSLVCTNDS